MKKQTKELIIRLGATTLAAALNVLIFLKANQVGEQLYVIAFFLVWFNLVFSWFTVKQQKPISYIFFATSIIIEILLVVNIYWISSRIV